MFNTIGSGKSRDSTKKKEVTHACQISSTHSGREKLQLTNEWIGFIFGTRSIPKSFGCRI